jgi:hypothetical protein
VSGAAQTSGPSSDGSALAFLTPNIAVDGQSGSPVWLDMPSNSPSVLHGVAVSANHANRITQSIPDDLWN